MISDEIIMNFQLTGGNTETETITANNNLVIKIMHDGNAWNAGIQSNPHGFELHYFENEACVRSVKFKNTGHKSIVYKQGEACD